MPNRFIFTKAAIAALPYETKSKYYGDEKERSLLLCVTAGSKSFVFYKRVQKRLINKVIGQFPEMSIEHARQSVKKLEMDAHESKFGADHANLLFGDLFRKYIDGYARHHTKRWEYSEDVYRLHIAPRWDRRKIVDVRRIDVQTWVNELGKSRTPAVANRTFDIFQAVFSYARNNDYIKDSPCYGIKRFDKKERSRFIAGEEEFSKLDAAITEEEKRNPLVAKVFRMSLHTGARKSNVLAMKWKDLQLKTKGKEQWVIPDEEAKSGEKIVVPLTKDAVILLEELRRMNPRSLYVFPSDSVKGHIVSVHKAWDRIRKRAGLLDLNIHDLRRTVASQILLAGGDLVEVQKALGHKNVRSTFVYGRLTNEFVRDSLERAQANMRKKT